MRLNLKSNGKHLFDDYQTLLGIKVFNSRLTAAGKCLKMPQFGVYAGHDQ